MAILTAFQPARRKRRLGLFKGQGRIAEDFDQLPAEIAAAFEGETR